MTHNAIAEQKARAEVERNWWKVLTALAEEGKVVEFYSAYTKYLEWNGIYSPSRKVLHKMARRVVEVLAEDDGEITPEWLQSIGFIQGTGGWLYLGANESDIETRDGELRIENKHTEDLMYFPMPKTRSDFLKFLELIGEKK